MPPVGRSRAKKRILYRPVDFAFDDDQELLRITTRRFLEDRRPLARVREVLDAEETFDRDVWQAGAELGWAAMLVPPEHGGGSVTGQPLVDLVVLAEELGRVLSPEPMVATNVIADSIARFGDDRQRAELLAPIARGELTGAWCLSGDGSADVEAIGVRATWDRHGLRLDGSAGFVPGAAVADLLLVAATSEEGLLHVLVRVPGDGVAIRRLATLDVTRRYGEVRFDGLVVPASAAVGGPAVAARALAVATVLQAAEAVGGADQLIGATVQYAKDRVQFGRPIGSFQAIKHRLADLAMTLEGMRAATHYAALAVADGFDDADEAVAVAGSYVVDAYAFVCGEAVQLHGGIGFTWEHDAHLFVRRAKVDQVLYGDPAWHRDRLCSMLERAAAGVG
jgi:alkylation response protein AidB-like acyl-CoA dehydrogenase